MEKSNAEKVLGKKNRRRKGSILSRKTKKTTFPKLTKALGFTKRLQQLRHKQLDYE